MRFLVFLLVATSSLPFLQHPTTDEARTRNTEWSAKADAQQDDGLFAAWLVAGNNNEIAMARIAVERAQNPKVKQFAQTMISEHGAMNQKLQPFAGNTKSNHSKPGETAGARDRDTDGAHREAGGPASDSRSREGAAGMPVGRGDHVALVQELKAQCLESSRRELESKSGAEFDRCYMAMMVGEHMQANDMLTVFRKHASDELEDVMADGQKHVSAHLSQAKDLCKQLDGSRERQVSGG